MSVAELKSLSFDEVRAQYRAYLRSGTLSESTIQTAYSDTFYLWKNAGRDAFWDALESENFEEEARAALRSALQAHSKGNPDALLGGYLAYLRRFRRFACSGASFASESRPREEAAPMKRKSSGTIEVPKPSVEEVTKALERWDSRESFLFQERALNRLFHDFCPENKTIEDILLKAAALNDFYSTHIYSIYPVAKHILELDIDGRLAEGQVDLVDDIQTVRIGGKKMHFYSFASKYCSHHNEKDYPIYDSYVDAVLRYFRDLDGDSFARFHNVELKVYTRFKKLMLAFRAYYGLERFSLKEIDKYIWQLGKKYFSKNNS